MLWTIKDPENAQDFKTLGSQFITVALVFYPLSNQDLKPRREHSQVERSPECKKLVLRKPLSDLRFLIRVTVQTDSWLVKSLLQLQNISLQSTNESGYSSSLDLTKFKARSGFIRVQTSNSSSSSLYLYFTSMLFYV